VPSYDILQVCYKQNFVRLSVLRVRSLVVAMSLPALTEDLHLNVVS